MKSKSVKPSPGLADISALQRVSMESLCEKEKNGSYLSIAKLKKVFNMKKLQPWQRAAAREALKIIEKGKATYNKIKHKFGTKKSLDSVKRVELKDKVEWHHLIFKSLGGSDTVGKNVIPLSKPDHIAIHVLFMCFVKDWEAATSAVFMMDMNKRYLEDILNGLDSTSLHVTETLVKTLRAIDSEARSKARLAPRKKKKYLNLNLDLQDQIQHRYTDEDALAYFKEHGLAMTKTWKEWTKLKKGEVMKAGRDLYTKGIEWQDLSLKRRINSDHRAEQRRVRQVKLDFGEEELTEEKLMSLLSKDDEGDYNIRAVGGWSLGKVKHLKKYPLRKVYRACGFPGTIPKQDVQVRKISDYLDLNYDFSQMNI